MAIPESMLKVWSRQGSTEESAYTYDSIKSVIEANNSPYSHLNPEVYLQGSYGNDTNTIIDSDVDIVICFDRFYHADLKALPSREKASHQEDFIPADYTFKYLQKNVLDWLIKNLGDGIKLGNKAIFVPGNNGRRDADVLVCIEHRRYVSYRPRPTHYHSGICFWTKDDRPIINFPKQHRENCTIKHQATFKRFKPSVRIWKSLRYSMMERGILPYSAAPSYFIEGMLWNVPDDKFSPTYQESFANCFNWLVNCDPSTLMCANNLDRLIDDDTDECWNTQDFQRFLDAVRQYWNRD